MAFEDFPHHIQELLRRAKNIDEVNGVPVLSVNKQIKFIIDRDGATSTEESEKL